MGDLGLVSHGERAAGTRVADGLFKASTMGTPRIDLRDLTPPRVLSLEARQGAPDYLVVLLHGVGGRAEDLMPVARRWAATMPGAEFVVPDGCHPLDGSTKGERQWFSVRQIDDKNRAGRVRHAAAEVSAWLDEELAKRSLGRDRLVIAGFSQGAILTEWLAVHRSPRPLAVVAFSGRFADDEAPTMSDTPALLVHGTADPVMPPALAQEAHKALAARGLPVEVFLESGLAHAIGDRGIAAAAAFLDRVVRLR